MSSKSNRVFTFTWRIENYFSLSVQNSKVIISPAFIAEDLTGREWFVKLFPDGYAKMNKGYISCCLCNTSLDAGPRRHNVCCNIEIIDTFGEVLVRESMQSYSLNEDSDIVYDKLLNNLPFLEYSKYLPEDSLTIRCNMMSSTTTQIPEWIALTKIGVDRCSLKLPVCKSDAFGFIVKRTSFQSSAFQFEISAGASGDDFKFVITKSKKRTIHSCFLICRTTLLDLIGNESISSYSSHLYKDDYWQFLSKKFNLFVMKNILKDGASKFMRSNSFIMFCDLWLPNGTRLTESKYIPYQCPIPVNLALSANPVKAVNSALSVNSVKAVNSALNENPVKLVESALKANSVEMIDSTLSVNSVKAFLDDFRKLYTSHENSDIKLRADNQTIPAHKLVLSARSPVFRAMFGQDMLENQTGIVDICDIDVKSLKDFLGFIYTGIVAKKCYESSLMLFVTAEKYQVLSLKEECSSFLLSFLSVKNVCEVVVVADKVGHEQLKSSAMDYIVARSSKILPTVTWKKFVKENAFLATEILYKLSLGCSGK